MIGAARACVMGASGAAAAAPVLADFDVSIDDGGVASKTMALSGVAGNLFIGASMLRTTDRELGLISGFTSLFGGPVGHPASAGFRVHYQYRFLTGSESNPAFTTSGVGTQLDEWACWMAKITGASSINGTPALGNSTSETRSPICPTMTTSAANCLILRPPVGQGAVTSADANNPTDTTLVFGQNGAGMENVNCHGLAYHVQAVAGATGTATWTNFLTANNRWFAATIAVAP